MEDNDSPLDLDKLMTSTFDNCKTLQSNVTQICPILKNNQHLIIIGFEDGKVCLVSNEVKYLKGHPLQVRRVLTTPDLNYAITSSRDKTVKLWDLASGQEFASFDCGSDVVSIDVYKQFILAGCENGKVLLINLDDSSIIQLEGHNEMIRWVAIAPNGERYFSLSNDKTVKVYDCEGRSIGTLVGHENWVTRIGIRSDGSIAVTGSTDKKVIVWDLERMELDCELTGHTDEIWSVLVTANGKWAASGSNDKTICLWNLNERTLQFTFVGHTHQIPHIKASEDSQYLISASYDKTVKLWNLESQTLEASFEGHTHFVRCAEFSPDNETIFSGGADKTLRKWSLRVKQASTISQGHTDWIRRLAVLPNNKKFVSASKDKTVRLWSVEGKLEHTFTGHKDEIWGLAVTPDGKFAVSGSHDKTVKMWNLMTLVLEHTFEGHENWVTFVFITPDGRYAVTPSHDSTIGIWDLQERVLVSKLQGHTGAVVRLALSADGKYAYSSSRDKTVRIWDIYNAQLIASFTEHNDLILALAVDNMNKILVTGCNDKVLRFYSIANKRILGSVEGAHGGDINRIVITPEGTLAASASDDRTIKVWAITTMSLLWVLEGHTNIVTWIEMSQDGKYIISASRDKTVKLWSLEKVSLETSFNNHSDVLYSVALTSNSEFAISGSFDKTIAIHKLFPIPLNQTKYEGVFNASLEAVGNILNYKNKPFTEDMKDALILPLHVNMLHLYAFTDKFEDITEALRVNTPYFASSKFGSPLLLAIQRNNFEVINAIIEYFSRVSTEKPVKFDVFGTLKSDLHHLLRIRLRTICDLLTDLPLIGNRTDLVKYIGFDSRLPEITFSNMHEFGSSLFQFQTENKALIQVNYYAVPFRINLETGSNASLALLQELESTPNSNLFVSRFVTAIIDYKWQRLRPFFILEFINYAVFLVLMCVYLTNSSQNVLGNLFILIFNSTCLVLELLQLTANPFSYFKSFWNILDVLRIVCCYSLVSVLLIVDSSVIEKDSIDYAKIIMMLLCWVKGLSYFRMFDITRYFVTMLTDIIKDSIGFTTIFFYSIIAFSNLFQIIISDPDSTYFSMFESTFELIFGIGDILDITSQSSKVRWLIFFFTTLIVTVIMLNLLISVFGDTYDRVQMQSSETSNKVKIFMIHEIEKLFFWKRNSGTEKYMIICDKIELENDDWEGKVKTIVQKMSFIEEGQKTQFRALKEEMGKQRDLSVSAFKDLENKIDILLRTHK